MILSDEELRHIETYLDVQCGEPDANYDVAFVFGTKLEEPAFLAAELLGRERARYALLTGGMNKNSGKVEATEHAALIKARGIAPERLIIESRSKNTQENVSLGLEKLWSVLRYHEVKKIVAITKWYHSRRALMTLKKQLPVDIEVSNISYEPAGCTRAQWSMNSESLWLVMKEWKTIPQYLEFGHLAEL